MTAVICAATDLTISLAAGRLGIEDPIVIADELRGVDVAGLDQWFAQAARIQLRLFQGADRLADAGPLLAAGWSDPSPRLDVDKQCDAALASRQVVGTQVDAADLTGSILRQSRTLVDGERANADAALIATGWPPGQDLFSWAVDNGQIDPIVGIISGLLARVTQLRTRNEQTLSDLAHALRADPRDSLDALASSHRVHGAATDSAATGGIDRAQGVDPSGVDPSGVAPSGVDQANLDRLNVDLRSTDAATQQMAQGVQAALQKARASGDVAQLLVYESANSGSQGTVAIGIGDIAEADNVAVLAPGVGNAPVNMAAGIGSATAIREAAQQRSPGDKTTVVSWYGYDMPLAAIGGVPMNPIAAVNNTTAVVDDSTAQEGGQRLAADLERFRELAPDSARFIAAGFSMGATTVSAAAGRGAKVDDVVLLAAPGASNDVASVADYQQVPAGHVFVASYDEDPVTTGAADLTSVVVSNLTSPFPSLPDFTPYGPDPASSDFGGQVMDVRTNMPDVSINLGAPFGLVLGPVTNEVLDLVINHQESNYLTGESLDAVSAIVTGQYGDIPIKPGR